MWARAKLALNGHAQFEQCRYSAPYLLIGEPLWLRATSSAVQIYRDHEMVAVHPRLTRPGSLLRLMRRTRIDLEAVALGELRVGALHCRIAPASPRDRALCVVDRQPLRDVAEEFKGSATFVRTPR